MKIHPEQAAREKMLKEMIDRKEETQAGLNVEQGAVPPFPIWSGALLKVKKLNPEATIPTKANPTDAGYDLYALEGGILEKHTHQLIKTGISLSIPEGYAGLIWPRSGMAYKHGIDVFAGVIDSSYRGDVGVILFNSQYNNYHIKAGDRIAQIVFQTVQNFDLQEVDNLDDTKRGKEGFGSSGK